ncbi:MAG: L-threonine 3-dehydrogenase [Geminicoccaceae bacterium]
MGRILVTGASGQIGSELVSTLREQHGADQVVASDVREIAGNPDVGDAIFEHVDCTDLKQLQDVIRRHDVDVIYHLAALLSAVAEERPQMAWSVNMGGLYRILEVARQYRCAVFFPSSIGAFGPTTPREATPQDTVQRPSTIYGVTKVSGELLCDYYAQRFGVDARGLRFPGLISSVTLPGGGTTDYAVEIFYQAIRYRHYTCFLRADTRLDMMYMPDAIRGMIQLMAADPDRLTHRNAFNMTAMSITPAELAAEIRKHIPGFVIDYEVDPVRQAIADSWPMSVDDGAARTEWGWSPTFDLASMTADMIDKLERRLRTVPSLA